jgi:hypothetical protein
MKSESEFRTKQICLEHSKQSCSIFRQIIYL